MLDSKARHLVEGVSSAVGRAVGRLGVSPNGVTAAGLLVTFGAGALILAGRFVAAGLVLIVAGVLDVLDGAVARATGTSSVLGALLDSVADRLSDGLVLGSIAWVLAQEGDELGSALALVALVAGALVSYIRARAESVGLDCNVGVAERAERMILVIVGLVLDVLVPALAILAAAASVTVVQRLVHVRRQVRDRA